MLALPQKFHLLLNKALPPPSINNSELDIIFKEFLYHDLSNFLYLIIKKSNNYKELVNCPIFNELKHIYLMTIQDNMLRQEAFLNAYSAFEKQGIAIAPIKGIALLFDVFQGEFSRSMVDIDILIKKEDLGKAKEALQALGYEIQKEPFSEEYYYKHHCHIPFFSKYLLEVHWDIAVPSPNKIILPEIWNRLQKIEHNNAYLNLLSPEDTIFSLALHLRRFNKPFSLKYVYDLYKIIEKYNDKLDWPYISKYSRLNRLNSLIYYALMSIKIIFGCPIPIKVLNRFYPGILRAFLLKFLITKVKNNGIEKLIKFPSFAKYTYVFLRFLLYDNAIDFIKFILFMPIEEFARFYSVRLPSKKAHVIYSLRFFIMPLYFLASILFKNENSSYRLKRHTC